MALNRQDPSPCTSLMSKPRICFRRFTNSASNWTSIFAFKYFQAEITASFLNPWSYSSSEFAAGDCEPRTAEITERIEQIFWVIFQNCTFWAVRSIQFAMPCSPLKRARVEQKRAIYSHPKISAQPLVMTICRPLLHTTYISWRAGPVAPFQYRETRASFVSCMGGLSSDPTAWKH